MKLRLIGGLLLAALVPSLALAGTTLRLKSVGDVPSDSRFVSLLAASEGNVSSVDAGLYLVQWKNQITDADKAALQNLGLEILSYIPDDALLVSGSFDQANLAANLSFVGKVLPFRAGFKVDPALNRMGVFALESREIITLQTKKDMDASELSIYFSEVKKVADGLFVGETSLRKVWELAQRSDVIWIEPYMAVRTFDLSWNDLLGEATTFNAEPRTFAFTGYESGTRIMNVDAAYRAGFHGEGMLTAFADTGLDKGDMNNLIPDFQGQVAKAAAMGLGGKSWGDPQNHGTHVAGSIAGNGKSSDGQIRGSAYGARLVAQGLWSEILNNISIPGIPKLFKAAMSDGARIHSNSWGAPNSNGRYDSFTAQADGFIFENPEFLAVFAAGNDGADLNKDGMIDEGTVSSPGSAKNVLTVGASKNYLLEGGIQRKMVELRNGKDKWGAEPIASSMLSEDQRGMAGFSSRGPAQDGRIKPDVVAPGTNIVAARNTHPKADPAASWGIFNDHYLFMGGTSMATPLTSGAVTLVRQFLIKKLGTDRVSGALVKATVANSAKDLFPGQFGLRARGQEQPTPRPNNHEGWGLVDLEPLFSSTSFKFVDNWNGVRAGEESAVEINVRGGSHLSVTMAYADAPASPSATRALVNDIDLTVVTPDGRTLYPFGRNAKDSINNMEQIDIANPVAGKYRVIVKGANIPQGKNGAQPYALVISGGEI